jgi:hypothetical protein
MACCAEYNSGSVPLKSMIFAVIRRKSFDLAQDSELVERFAERPVEWQMTS